MFDKKFRESHETIKDVPTFRDINILPEGSTSLIGYTQDAFNNLRKSQQLPKSEYFVKKTM